MSLESMVVLYPDFISVLNRRRCRGNCEVCDAIRHHPARSISASSYDRLIRLGADPRATPLTSREVFRTGALAGIWWKG